MEITRDTIQNETGFKEMKNAICLPSKIQGMNFPFPDELYRKTKSGNLIYFWFTVDFEYLNNKKGQYGIILSYDKDESVSILDEWEI